MEDTRASVSTKSDRTAKPANGECGWQSGGFGNAFFDSAAGGTSGSDTSLGANNNTNFTANNQEGRAAAEKYLGRAMTDQEYNDLMAATYAEAGSNQQERAWVAGTILNRSRSTGMTVGEVLHQRSQFQAVTGTANNPTPSANFVNGPTASAESSINGSFVNYLGDVPQNNYFFDAADPNVYREGTSMPSSRNGVMPSTIGASRFYPGARWP